MSKLKNKSLQRKVVSSSNITLDKCKRFKNYIHNPNDN